MGKWKWENGNGKMEMAPKNGKMEMEKWKWTKNGKMSFPAYPPPVQGSTKRALLAVGSGQVAYLWHMPYTDKRPV